MNSCDLTALFLSKASQDELLQGDLFVANTFTPLGNCLYTIISFYIAVNGYLWAQSCHHRNVGHGWEVVEK